MAHGLGVFIAFPLVPALQYLRITVTPNATTYSPIFKIWKTGLSFGS